MDQRSDVELMLSLGKGDGDALGVLFERYERPLINFVYRMLGSTEEAEDVFQETFLRVMRNASTWEPKAAFSTWLYTIARNLALDRLKKIRGLPTVTIDGGPEDEGGLRDAVEGSEEKPGFSAEKRELAAAVRGALRQLPPPKREVLLLRVYLGMKYEEIARVVDAPLGTVKFRIHDALKSLAEILKPALADMNEPA